MNRTQTEQQIQKMVTDQIIPGADYAFINDDQVSTNFLGQAQLMPTQERLRSHMIYDVASLTKVVGTVPVILQLVQANRLSFDDSLSQYLPQWQFPEVTIHHLLTHTSGIEGYINNRNQLSRNALVTAFYRDLMVGSNFNQKVVYADINYIFLGWVAESILGAPIQALITKRVLQPLQMWQSGFRPNTMTQCVPTAVPLRGKVHDPKAQILGLHCGSAGLFSTSRDLTKFMMAMLHPEQVPGVLPPDVIHALNHDWANVAQGERSLGWGLQTEAGFPHVLWQSGHTGTVLVLNQQRQQGMVFLSHRVHPVAPNDAFMAPRNEMIQTYLAEFAQE